MAVVCVYEERDAAGSIVSTGRLTLEYAPGVDELLELGGRTLRVADVRHVGADEVRVVLEPV
jgi:hypothetical protein